EMVVKIRLAAVNGDRPTDMLDCLAATARLMRRHAEQMPGGGVLRLGGQHLPIELLGFGESAGLMPLPGSRKCLGGRQSCELWVASGEYLAAALAPRSTRRAIYTLRDFIKSANSTAIRVKTLDQSPGRSWRKMRIVGYQGESSRSSSHRHSHGVASASQV